MDLSGVIDEKFKFQLVDWELACCPSKFEVFRIRKLSTYNQASLANDRSIWQGKIFGGILLG